MVKDVEAQPTFPPMCSLARTEVQVAMQTASKRSEAPQSASASAAELVKGRAQWLYFVHPEQPVAGQRATIYFNNNVSDILR